MIKVLCVDDEEGLLDICKAFLEGSGSITVDIALSVREAEDALQRARYDAIVCDYQMPEVTGIDFLKSLRSQGHNLPFILLTGKGREEVVIDALNSGADFYLQKGGDPRAQFTELEHVINKVVEKHRTEEALKESRRWTEDIIDFLPDATFAIDLEGRVIVWNKAIERMTGVLAKDILGKGDHENSLPFYGERRPVIADYVLSNDEEIANRYPYIERRGQTIVSETFVPLFNDGKGGVVWIVASRLYDSKGNLVGAIESIRDITQYRKVQRALNESEEFLNNVIENIPDMVFVKDAKDLKFVRINKAGEELTGLSREEIYGKNVLDIFPKEEAETFMSYDRSVLGLGHLVDIPEEIIHTRAKGVRTLHTKRVPLLDKEGRPRYLLGISQDITERRQAEEALERSEQFLKIVLDNFPGVVYWKNRDLVYLGANRESARIVGYADPSEFMGKTDYDMPWTRTEAEAYRADDRQVIESGQPKLHVIEEQHRVGGEIGWLDTSKVPLRDSEGNVIGVLGTSTDITERVRAEQRLQESEERNRRLLEQSFDAIVVHRDGKIIYANDAATKLIRSKSKEELVGQDLQNFIADESKELAIDNIQRLQKNAEAVSPILEVRLRCIDGEIIDAETIATSFLLNGRLTVQSVLRDITERKRIQNDLRRSEENFRQLVERSPDAMIIVAYNKIAYVNPAAIQLLGATSEEQLLGTMVIDHIDPRFKDLIKERKRRLEVEKKPVDRSDEVYLRLDGTPIDVEGSAVPCRYNDDDGALIILREITDRKRWEERLLTINQELSESKEMFQELFELGREAIMLVDRDTGDILECNTASSEMYGYSHEELLEMHNYDLSNEPEITTSVTRDMRSTLILPLLYHRRKDGSVFPVEIHARPFTWKGRGVYVSAIRDITDRKRAEDALREVNRKLGMLNKITRHDILNRISTSQLNIEMARKLSTDPLVNVYLDRLDEAVRDIHGQIEFTRIYQDLGHQDPMWQSMYALLRGLDVPEGLTFLNDVREDVEVYADPMLGKVFYNLLDNSVRHGVKTTTIRVSLIESDGGMAIRWEDDGCGIPASDKDRIFDHGYGKNTGLGLFMTREILAITNITIRETGTEGDGARFEILVPRSSYRPKDMVCTLS